MFPLIDPRKRRNPLLTPEFNPNAQPPLPKFSEQGQVTDALAQATGRQDAARPAPLNYGRDVSDLLARPTDQNESRDAMYKYGRDDVSPRPQPLALPYGAPPLTGTKADPLPPVTEQAPGPLVNRVPFGASPEAFTMPDTMTPKAPDQMTDYRGDNITDSLDFRKDQFVREGGKTDEKGKFHAKRSTKTILLNALLGGLQGMGNGQGLAGGIGGALAGGIGSAIAPTNAREYLFNATQAPRLMQQQQREQQRNALQRQAEADALKRKDTEAGISLKNAQARKALMPPASATARPAAPNWQRVMIDGKPQLINVNDPKNQQGPIEPYIQAPAGRQQTIADAEAELAGIEGSAEQIANSSYQGRGGDAYEIAKLPPAIRQILETGKVVDTVEKLDKDGKQVVGADGRVELVQQERPAKPAEIEAAMRARDAAIQKAKAADLSYTKGVARSKSAAMRGGAKPLAKPSSGAPASNGGKATLGDLKKRFLK